MQIKELPEGGDVGQFEIVDRKLLFILEAHIVIADARRPLDIVDAFDILEEFDDALQAVGQLGRDQVEVDAAALLEVSELGYFETIQHHLPADSPGAQSWRLPVVLFELDVVLAEVDADGGEAAEVLIYYVCGRRLKDYLKLLVLVEAVGILAVASVGGAAAGLNVGHAIGLRAEHAQERFGSHGASADFEVVGFLDDAAAIGPVL